MDVPETYRTGRNCRMKNRQRRSDMTETDTTAPVKGAIQGRHRRALSDIQINKEVDK